ncbi:MAG: helix-turn-helix transcriptional regulator [Proteobacteria bacterium]|nr:helix-turn-helix transcriptional regulator [Pseudomonadota bacterium]MCP4288450.1 helix-turn-helix transcriptional regulator [Gammaproteobacteria bacterium]
MLPIRTQIKRYETGGSQPSLDVLKKIAIALNISADALLFDKDERGPDDELRLQFETVSQFNEQEKLIAQEVLRLDS